MKPVPDNPEGKGRQNDNHQRDTYGIRALLSPPTKKKGAATAQQIIVGFGDTTIRKKAALPRNNRSIEKAARNTDTTKEREADKGRIPTTINQAKRKQLFEQTQEDEVVG